MHVLRKWFVQSASVMALSITAISSVYAANSYDTAFTNGTIAKSLDNAISAYLISKSVQDFGFSIYQQGRSFDSGQEFVSSSPDQDFVNRHSTAYCSPNIAAEVTGFGCKAKKAEEMPYLELGDINFATLLDPIHYSSDLFSLAAQNLIRTIVSPFPPSTYKTNVADPNFLVGGGSKKTAFANYLAGQAVVGVALYSFNTMYEMRVLGKNLGLTNNAQDPNSPGGFSLLDIIEKESTRRFEGTDSPTFASFLNDPATDQTKLLKEMAAMEAFRLWMDYQRFRQMERVESLLAASLSKYVNSSYSSEAMLGSATTSSSVTH